MKKKITLFLSGLLFLLSVTSTGCFKTSYENSSSILDGNSTSETLDSSSEEKEEPKGEPFTVTLRTADGGQLTSVEGIKAIWTDLNGANIYQAPFNEGGVATCYGPDGEYQVTLSNTPNGYTYNPNVYISNNDTRDEVISLYPLRQLTGGDGTQYNSYKAKTTGAYRFTFDSPKQEFYFSFGAAFSGNISFESMLDVTENEVLPIFYECFGVQYAEVRKKIVGGGVENTYTKNFYCSYNLTGSQGKIFKIGVETLNANAFPVSIDVLVEKEGEYSDGNITLQPMPVPENLPKAPENDGRWVYLRAGTQKNVLSDAMVVYDETDDRYYYNANYNKMDAEGNPLPAVANKDRMVYAMLKKDIDGVLITDGGTGLSYPMITHRCYEAGLDYTAFINAHFNQANSDGAYPVTKALKQYLYDFAESKQLFFDGEGSAEGDGGLSTDSSSRWLFACGYYI